MSVDLNNGGYSGLDFNTGIGAASGRTMLFGVWFKLGSFTSNRALWGWASSATCGVKLDGTTEIKITTAAGTDAVWTSTDASLSVGNWYCLSVMTYQVSSNHYAAVAWLSDGAGSAPRKLSLTETVAGAGSVTSAANSYGVIGNTGTLSLLGLNAEIGVAWYYAGSRTSNAPIYADVSGYIDTEMENQAYRLFVLPLWRGNEFPIDLHRMGTGVLCVQENDLFSQDDSSTDIPQFRTYSSSGGTGIQVFSRNISTVNSWITKNRTPSQGSMGAIGHDVRRR